MKTRLFVVFFLLASFVGPVRGQGNDDAVKKRFLSEYPGALRAWQARFSNAMGKVRVLKNDSFDETVYLFKLKLPHMAVLTTIQDKDGLSKQSVSGFNESYSFVLQNAGSARDYAIRSLKPADGTGQVPKNSYIWNILWMPYSTRVRHDLLFSTPSFVVRGVVPLRRNEKSLLKIDFDWSAERKAEGSKGPGYYGGLEGSFAVSPEEKWVLYEFDCRQKEGQRLLFKGTLDYEGTLEGFPLPKRAVYRTLKPSGDEVSSTCYEFQEFGVADLPDREFTLTAFGIPEQVSRPATVARTGWRWYWFLALALAALAAAVFFKIASSRIQRTSNT